MPTDTANCRSDRKRIFIIHPSDWLTDHLSIGDGLVAHGFLWELASRGHDIHIAARMAEIERPFPSNVTIHRIPHTVRLRPLDRLEYMLRVRLLFRSLNRAAKFDVAHQMNPVFAGLSLCMIGTGVPIVLGTFVPDWPDDPDAVTSRRGVAGRLARWLKMAVCRQQQKRAAALLITSPAALPRIPDHERLRARILDMQHGMDTALFSPAETSGVAEASILFLANLGVKKGIFVLLDAFAKVHSAMANCRLTIAGDGAELEQIRAIVQAQPWRNNVSILGEVPRYQAPDLYRSHSVYCLPSFGEPYGSTVIEAMSCGRPVVTTDAGGMRYLVTPGRGLLVPPRDPERLAEALIQVLQNPGMAAEMGRCNREWVLATHRWAVVGDRLDTIYSDLVESKRNGIRRHARAWSPASAARREASDIAPVNQES